MAGQRSRLRGDIGFRKIIRQLPPAVKEGMADLLDEYGHKLLTAMQRDVPVRTGLLRSRLSMKLSRSTLQLRVGFIGKKAYGRVERNVTEKFNGRRRKLPDQFHGDQFYGRFVEFGRKAQNVYVTRRAKALRITGNNKNGSRRRIRYGAGVYLMRVPAMAARPFIFRKRPDLRRELSTRLSNYWGYVLAAAAEGAPIE